MDPATLIILVLLLLIVAIPVITSLRLSKSTTQRSTSPAPAMGNSTATPSASSGGGSAQKGKSIPSWIIPLGIAYLVIRGLFIIWRNYITPLDWIAIVLISFFAILNFWNGKNRWLSLVLIVAVGCIIWFNQAHIDSFKPKTPTTEQSAEQPQQVAPAPVEEEIISKEPILPRTNNPTILKKSGEYNIPKGKYRLCFSWLGHDNGYVNQGLKIGEQEFASTESKCLLVDIISDKTNIDFINPYQTDMDTYEIISKQPGGQGVYPFLEPVK